jgi:hypothetical protein
MADMTTVKDRIAGAAHSKDTSITGPLLFVTSFAIAALFIAETIFGLLWTLGGEVRTYVSFLQ